MVWDPALDKYLGFGTLKTAAIGKLPLLLVFHNLLKRGFDVGRVRRSVREGRRQR